MEASLEFIIFNPIEIERTKGNFICNFVDLILVNMKKTESSMKKFYGLSTQSIFGVFDGLGIIRSVATGIRPVLWSGVLSLYAKTKRLGVVIELRY